MKHHRTFSTVAQNLVKTFIVVILATHSGCIPSERKASIQASVEQEAEELRKVFVPDRRMGVFQFAKDDQGGLTSFETDHPVAFQKVDSLLKANGFDHIPVQQLPDPSLGDTTHAIVRVGVANLRREPRHGAELVDQTIMGTKLKILKRQGGWVYVQTPYRYLGWMTLESATVMTSGQLKAWETLPKIQVQSVWSGVYEAKHPNSLKLSDLSMNAILAMLETAGDWVLAQLPDGRTGYIPGADVGNPVIAATQIPDGWQVVNTASKFHGIPYLWGGNSSRGLDCSGYTQTVYAANGYQLPRDANMQVEGGMDVPIDSTFSQVVPGDLLFFGENDRITHVAISLGGPKFIHASTYVMMNSLSPGDSDYNEYRRQTLQRIKRLTAKQENL